MLCKIALGWFFLWRKSGTVVAVGVPDVFLPCGWIGLLIFLRNEKKQCANLWVDSKKCDRKKQQQGGCAEAGIKTVQAPLRQAQRPLGKLRWR